MNSANGPYVTASVKNGNAQNNAQSTLDYYIQVNGPRGNVMVDVSYSLSDTFQFNRAGFNQTNDGGGTASLGVQGTTFSASSTLSILDFGGNAYGAPEFNETAGTVFNPQTNTYSITSSSSSEFSIATGTPYLVTLNAHAGCDAANISNLCISMVDPIFTIDPSQSESSQYSLQFSPDIGNGIAASAVPEPQSLGMLSVGIGLAAIGARRRRAHRA